MAPPGETAATAAAAAAAAAADGRLLGGRIRARLCGTSRCKRSSVSALVQRNNNAAAAATAATSSASAAQAEAAAATSTAAAPSAAAAATAASASEAAAGAAAATAATAVVAGIGNVKQQINQNLKKALEIKTREAEAAKSFLLQAEALLRPFTQGDSELPGSSSFSLLGAPPLSLLVSRKKGPFLWSGGPQEGPLISQEEDTALLLRRVSQGIRDLTGALEAAQEQLQRASVHRKCSSSNSASSSNSSSSSHRGSNSISSTSSTSSSSSSGFSDWVMDVLSKLGGADGRQQLLLEKQRLEARLEEANGALREAQAERLRLKEAEGQRDAFRIQAEAQQQSLEQQALLIDGLKQRCITLEAEK
ncbi:hypothetical protein Emed_000870 [Eimeria media]